VKPTARDFYLVSENWERFTITPALEAKARLLAGMIPADTRRLLDLGCGNGLISQSLRERHAVVGLDWSLPALGFAQGERVCASAARLPLKPGVFDLVLCSELLEHLSEDDLRDTLREMTNLRAAHLLISVPNRENTHINEVKCPACRLIFNASHHQRSFTPESLSALFPGYRAVETRVDGMPVRDYPRALLRLRQRTGGRWFQVPDARTVFCPQCGNRSFPRRPHNPLTFACDGLNRLVSRRHPYWLYMLLRGA
jgi:SAM-dependent methyltransferase